MENVFGFSTNNTLSPIIFLVQCSRWQHCGVPKKSKYPRLHGGSDTHLDLKEGTAERDPQLKYTVLGKTDRNICNYILLVLPWKHLRQDLLRRASPLLTFAFAMN